MSPRARQLARLLRALIACCALLFAFEAPSFAAAAPRDTSGWIAERVAVAAVTRSVLRAPAAARARARQRQPLGASTPLPCALTARSASGAPAGRRTTFDARHLYLDLRTLLC